MFVKEQNNYILSLGKMGPVFPRWGSENNCIVKRDASYGAIVCGLVLVAEILNVKRLP